MPTIWLSINVTVLKNSQPQRMKLWRTKITVLLGTLILGWAMAAGCRAETFTCSIPWGGLTRTYRLYLPPAPVKSGRSLPLVIALHGGGGNAGKMLKLTQGGFNTLADKEGFLVVYPNGVENHWNDGRENARYRALREKIDDVGFISALIDRLAKDRNIDQQRVYVAGISNGAMMAQRLACERAGKIAAIAAVAGNLPDDRAPQGSPARPLSVLMISGTADPMMPWDGGEVRFFLLKLGRVLSVAQTVKFWVTRNRCSPIPVITRLPHRNPRDATRVRREVYGDGDLGTEVVLYAIEGGGHTWPGGRLNVPESFTGPTSQDLNACEVIWSFFTRHSVK
jgi:polyhydroxybutyrate depolymerase